MIHLEEIIQYMVDDIEGAMPHTLPMTLTGIHSVLSPDQKDTEVPTSIVFARIIDLIEYMKQDPFKLLFARNVRVSLGPTDPNKGITSTFQNAPKEFAFSNNGITMLCDNHSHNPGSKELRIENPRVVNGAQTLHSVCNVAEPSNIARVMIRIVELPPSGSSDISEKVKKRKDIIHKIATRSNMQNPIKSWDLVSNDDFQQDLGRYFWHKKIFYERRQKEWVSRSRQLTSLGFIKGPTSKKIAQLIASFNWQSTKFLGPANAKNNVGALFEEVPYEQIRETTPGHVYQLHLINKWIGYCYNILAEDKQYLSNLNGHVDLTLFAIITAAFSGAQADWGSPALVHSLERQWLKPGPKVFSLWIKLTNQAASHIRSFYLKADKKYRKREKTKLSPNNFFKTPSYVQPIFQHPIPAGLRKSAHAILSQQTT